VIPAGISHALWGIGPTGTEGRQILAVDLVQEGLVMHLPVLARWGRAPYQKPLPPAPSPKRRGAGGGVLDIDLQPRTGS